MDIRPLDFAAFESHLGDFATVLHGCVAAGASVGFVEPFSLADARSFFADRVGPNIRAGDAVIWGAYEAGKVVGTVQLALPTMPNQLHKADVSKMLVHPDFRRRGLARGLMEALIAEARARGFHMLTLDTRTGDAAQPLYGALGFEVAGEIPDFAIDPFDPSKLDGTTYMYLML